MADVPGRGRGFSRLFPPLVPAAAPAALLFACSLRASGMSFGVTQWPGRGTEKGCHTNLQGGMCSIPGASESVGNLQQTVWLCGTGGLAGQTALNFHCAFWHQAEPSPPGQKPGPAQSISLMGQP